MADLYITYSIDETNLNQEYTLLAICQKCEINLKHTYTASIESPFRLPPFLLIRTGPFPWMAEELYTDSWRRK